MAAGNKTVRRSRGQDFVSLATKKLAAEATQPQQCLSPPKKQLFVGYMSTFYSDFFSFDFFKICCQPKSALPLVFLCPHSVTRLWNRPMLQANGE